MRGEALTTQTSATPDLRGEIRGQDEDAILRTAAEASAALSAPAANLAEAQLGDGHAIPAAHRQVELIVIG